MTDDILQQMTRALSEEYDGATAVPEATRARVIRTLAERRPRRRKWLTVGIPLFALLGGSTAWAAATGRLDRIVEKAVAVIQWQSEEVVETSAVPRVQKQSLGQKWTPPPVPSVEETATAQQDEPESAPDPAPSEPSLPTQSARVVRANDDDTKSTPAEPEAMEAESPTEEEDHTALLTFRSAHRAQFSEGNCARAIAGYDQYLRLDPSGPFGLEAKYNRGVCLVRVGRIGAAKAALEPFAQGVYGDYRRSQSAELLRALDSGNRPEPSPFD